MKVFIPFKLQELGGTSTFAAKFKAGLEAAGHQATLEFCDDYDVMLVIVQCPLEYLRHAKGHHKPIVQRLDGTYYWSVSGWRFPLLNFKAMYIRHFFADFTVYQSEYSRRSANRFLGPKSDEKAAIIYNGVDLATFSADGPKAKLRDNPNQKIFLTASAFRRRDQIRPIIEAVNIYKQRHDNFKLVVAGTFKAEVAGLPDQITDPHINFVGKISNSDLPKYERASDVFLFTHLNPPCPNNVIEALACGLPVCGVADGAMPELVKPNHTGQLLPSQGEAYWQRRQIDTNQFAANIQTILDHQTQYSNQASQIAQEKFGLDTMINKYVAVFKTLLND